MEVMQLLYEIIFLLTPDDRSSCISGEAVVAVAGVANEQLGAEDRLGLGGISRRGQRGHLNSMLNGICRRGQRGQNDQNDQNAETSRKVIVGHILTLPPVRVPAVRDATIALQPPQTCRSQTYGARWRRYRFRIVFVHQILPPICAALRTARTIRLWAPQL